MPETEVSVTINGKQHVVKLKSINYGTYNKIMKQATSVKLVGDSPSGSFDVWTMRFLITKESIVSGLPIPLEEVPPDVGLLLEKKAMEINGLELGDDGSFHAS